LRLKHHIVPSAVPIDIKRRSGRKFIFTIMMDGDHNIIGVQNIITAGIYNNK